MPIPFLAPLLPMLGKIGGAALTAGKGLLGAKGLMGGLGMALTGNRNMMGNMMGGIGGMLGGLPGALLGKYKKHSGPLPPGGLLLASMLGNMGAAYGGKGSFADRLNTGAQKNIGNQAYARSQQEMLAKILEAINARKAAGGGPPPEATTGPVTPAQTQQVPGYAGPPQTLNPGGGSTLVAGGRERLPLPPGWTQTVFGPQAPGTINM